MDIEERLGELSLDVATRTGLDKLNNTVFIISYSTRVGRSTWMGYQILYVCTLLCRFMAAWVFEENASKQTQKKREAEEADKVEVAPGVNVAVDTSS